MNILCKIPVPPKVLSQLVFLVSDAKRKQRGRAKNSLTLTNDSCPQEHMVPCLLQKPSFPRSSERSVLIAQRNLQWQKPPSLPQGLRYSKSLHFSLCWRQRGKMEMQMRMCSVTKKTNCTQCLVFTSDYQHFFLRFQMQSAYYSHK